MENYKKKKEKALWSNMTSAQLGAKASWNNVKMLFPMNIRSIAEGLDSLKLTRCVKRNKRENSLRKKNLFIVIFWMKYIYGFKVVKTKKTTKWDFKNRIVNFRIWSTISNGLDVDCNTFSTVFVQSRIISVPNIWNLRSFSLLFLVIVAVSTNKFADC